MQPFLPDKITFRDGDLIRPVAPFFEIWARVGKEGSAAETWQDVPLTLALLDADGLGLADVSLTFDARNLKAARRIGDFSLAFGTFPPVRLRADNQARVQLFGTSPAEATAPMIPRDRPGIPLGTVQFLKGTPQLQGQPWSNAVNIETLRFRLTPAAGVFYGPPEATQASPQNGRPEPAVRPENAFLDASAGWAGASTIGYDAPADTYDVVNQLDTTGPSLGVVDDTCEVHFDISLETSSPGPLRARAIAFVGPPDFSPDRRPFVSAADEINDRSADAASRSSAMSDDDLDRWVEDLFERVYETVSLLNVDAERNSHAVELPPEALRLQDLDRVPRLRPTAAMGGRDPLRNPIFAIPGTDAENLLLPFSAHARMRHRAMSDLQNLRQLVADAPERIAEVIRPPFEINEIETGQAQRQPATSMQMPPFMRQSNAGPLTLTNWQYELLLRWIERTLASGQQGLQPFRLERRMSPSAVARRDDVLARIDAALVSE